MPTWTAATYRREGASGRAGERATFRRVREGAKFPTFRLPIAQSPDHPFLLSSDRPVAQSIAGTPFPLPTFANSGFTLLELAVVLFIIGLLVATVAPHLGNVGSTRLDATARRLAAVVRYLSGEAAMQNRPYRLNYDLDKQTYWVTRLVLTQESAEFSNDASPLSRPVHLPPTITFADVQAPGVGRVSAGRVYTHFLPQGYADPTVIHLRDQHSRIVTVLIPPLTGEARIYEGYVDGFVRR